MPYLPRPEVPDPGVVGQPMIQPTLALPASQPNSKCLHISDGASDRDTGQFLLSCKLGDPRDGQLPARTRREYVTAEAPDLSGADMSVETGFHYPRFI